MSVRAKFLPRFLSNRMKRWRSIFFISAFFFLAPFTGTAGEIQLDNIQLVSHLPDRYEVSVNITNAAFNSREIVLRAQVFFYDAASPKGDIPVMILRKDETIVMKSGEQRTITVKLINEGILPKGRLRLEPEIRIRRQREWNY